VRRRSVALARWPCTKREQSMPGNLKEELAALDKLLGDTRVRYRFHKTPFNSAEALIQVDQEVRDALASPPSPELEAEVLRLTAKLHALDPR
jgi:hypothetical protein